MSRRGNECSPSSERRQGEDYLRITAAMGVLATALTGCSLVAKDEILVTIPLGGDGSGTSIIKVSDEISVAGNGNDTVVIESPSFKKDQGVEVLVGVQIQEKNKPRVEIITSCPAYAHIINPHKRTVVDTEKGVAATVLRSECDIVSAKVKLPEGA